MNATNLKTLEFLQAADILKTIPRVQLYARPKVHLLLDGRTACGWILMPDSCETDEPVTCKVCLRVLLARRIEF